MQLILKNLYAAFRLILMDRKALSYFSHSPEQLRFSLIVPLVAFFIYAPFMTLYLYTSLQDSSVNLPDYFWTGKPIKIYMAMVIGWLVNLLIVYKIAGMIDRADSFKNFVMAWNWAIPIQVFALIPMLLVASMGWGPLGVQAFFQGVIVAFIYIYKWFIIKTALKLSNLPAIGLVFLLTLVAEMILALVLLS